jgi:hypothetical protein
VSIFVRNLWMKIYPNSFRPKWSFIESIPGGASSPGTEPSWGRPLTWRWKVSGTNYADFGNWNIFYNGLLKFRELLGIFGCWFIILRKKKFVLLRVLRIFVLGIRISDRGTNKLMARLIVFGNWPKLVAFIRKPSCFMPPKEIFKLHMYLIYVDIHTSRASSI